MNYYTIEIIMPSGGMRYSKSVNVLSTQLEELSKVVKDIEKNNLQDVKVNMIVTKGDQAINDEEAYNLIELEY